ncbi:mycothiol system anti-sigma-R factor [Kitasatospora sp. NPDC048239]|uniref:mycothiol system anti-sigma-R factor n=1 Tax=Kitasatospora sp. NPDC048239 TaxID=3364046 RepID=UPI0037211514
MSCGDPHDTECGEVLDHLYEFLDNEMAEGDYDKLRVHFEECSPCLEKYGLEQAIKALIKRCCGCDDTPADLRGKVLARIDSIRAGQRSGEAVVVAVDAADVHVAVPPKAATEAAVRSVGASVEAGAPAE